LGDYYFTREGEKMKKGICSRRAWLNATGIFLLLLSVTAFATPSGLMLSYTLTNDMLRTQDNFSVTVYEDGVVLVHYPDYMDKAGDYTVELSASEVQQLRLQLENPLVQDFNPGQAKAEKNDIDALSNEMFVISDDSWSNFEVHALQAPKSIRWANLSIEAARYPEIGVFQKLAEIEAQLMQLDQHPTASLAVD